MKENYKGKITRLIDDYDAYSEAVYVHMAMIMAYNIGCQPDSDTAPKSMLYYKVKNGELGEFLFQLPTHDPIEAVKLLGTKLAEIFPDEILVRVK